MATEKEIENSILEYLFYKRIMCWKNQTVGIYDPRKKVYRKNRNVFHRNGIPDILGILPDGKFLGIEVKAPSKYPSKNQREFIAEANESGAIVFVARSIQDVQNNLKEYL